MTASRTSDHGKETDLARVSRVRGSRFDLAFLQVMTAGIGQA